MASLPIGKKIEFLALVMSGKRALDDMFDDLTNLVQVTDTCDFSRQPVNAMAAKFVREAYDGEHGQLLRSLRTKLHDIADRLRDCGGDDVLILGMIDELAEIMPDMKRLDEQLIQMREDIENREKALIEMN